MHCDAICILNNRLLTICSYDVHKLLFLRVLVAAAADNKLLLEVSAHGAAPAQCNGALMSIVLYRSTRE